MSFSATSRAGSRSGRCRNSEKVTRELLLPVSIGACNAKWIAKLATSTVKPYGLRVVYDDEIAAFTRDVPVGEFPGVGRAFGKKLARYGIATVGEAVASPHLFGSWGRHGRDLYARMTGRDGEGISPRRSRKGIGMSRSMDRPILERGEFYRRVRVMVRHWVHTIARTGVNPTTFYFSIGYEGRLRSKKQYTVYRFFNEQFMTAFALEKFKELDVYPRASVVYIAMSATKFLQHDPKAVDLFTFESDLRMQRLDRAVTKMRDRYGMDILRRAAEMGTVSVPR